MLSLLSHLFSALAPLWEMSLTGAYVAVVVLLLRLALRNRAPRQAVCLLISETGKVPRLVLKSVIILTYSFQNVKAIRITRA